MLAFGRVLALVMLLLLPMQMRAGAADPHPHALLQLILDARDGAIDHHADDSHASNDRGHANEHGSHEPEWDVPVYGESYGVAASWALLVTLVSVFALPRPRQDGLWVIPSRVTGWLPNLDPPPPRVTPA